MPGICSGHSAAAADRSAGARPQGAVAQADQQKPVVVVKAVDQNGNPLSGKDLDSFKASNPNISTDQNGQMTMNGKPDFGNAFQGSIQKEENKAAAPSTPTAPANAKAGPISDAEIDKATGGDAKLSATLKKIATDPEGAKVLRDALNRGTTYKQEEQEPGRGGVTVLSSGSAPKISIAPSGVNNLSILAHESAHAAYPDMDHTDVYNLGYRVSDNLGVHEPRLPGYENIQ
jgi:hypothetical protein